MLKTIILPRQARDKDGKRLPRKTVSAEVLWVEALLQYYGASFPLWFVAFYRDIDR